MYYNVTCECSVTYCNATSKTSVFKTSFEGTSTHCATAQSKIYFKSESQSNDGGQTLIELMISIINSQQSLATDMKMKMYNKRRF